ncbi:MAG: hypothetical protein ACLSF6_00720 [Evtepia gabavorous]
MKLSFQTAGPDGARTLLVKTSVSPDAYQDLTQRLLSVQELQAQQVAFLTPPQGDGVVRLETAAGALSGDLLRQAGLAFAVSRGIRREKKFPVEAQSVPAPLLVHANPLTGQVTVDLPPPQAQGTRSLFGQQASVLNFPGLSYVICQGSALPPDPELRTLLPSWPGNGDSRRRRSVLEPPGGLHAFCGLPAKHRHPSPAPVLLHCCGRYGRLARTPAGGTA